MLNIQTIKEIKKVKKPWGQEIWYAGPHTKSKYVLKKIFIKSNYSSSIQFHEKKEETITIIEGTGYLIYRNKPIDIKKFKQKKYSESDITKIIKSLKKVKIKKNFVFTIKPGYIHSILSTNNIVFYEASTTEVDDVFRLRDVFGRGHGRIKKEHE